MPVTISKETIEWAARVNIPITPGANAAQPVRKDMIRFYAKCLESAGHKITPAHLNLGASVYVADSHEQAVKEAGPYMLYFFHTLFSHGNTYNVASQRDSGYRSGADNDYISPENQAGLLKAMQGFRSMTIEDVQQNERVCWGTPDEVRDALINLADSLGGETLMLNLNQGAMPHDMYMRNVKRFGEEVLPALQAHQVTTVPLD